MTQTLVRTIHPADAAAVASLCAQLGHPTTEDDAIHRIASILRQDQQALLVAERAGQILGWVHVFGAHRLESPPFAEIGGLVVDQTCRRTGAGRALVTAAADWARHQGFRHLRVRANVVREEAHAFYRHLGFSNSKWQAVFSRALNPG